MKKTLRVYFLLVLAALATSSFSGSGDTGTIYVKITGLRSDNGQVAIALYNSKDGFPTKIAKSVKHLWAKVRNNQCEAVFTGMPYGDYALCAYHDENGNGKLDFNFLGIPKEGTSASNNARGHFGPPSFEDAKFLLNAASVVINMKMNY